jgi:hypothetical protein
MSLFSYKVLRGQICWKSTLLSVIDITQGACKSVIEGPVDKSLVCTVAAVGHDGERPADDPAQSSDGQGDTPKGPQDESIHQNEFPGRSRFFRRIGIGLTGSSGRNLGTLLDGKGGRWCIIIRPGRNRDASHKKR